MAKRKTEKATPAGLVTFAHFFRGVTLKYAEPFANIRYGNEMAQRAIDYIKSHAAPENHRRLMLSESARLLRTSYEVSRTRIKSPFGEHINTDYAEQLRQASFAVRLMA